MRPARPGVTVCLSIAALLLFTPIAGAQQKEELPHPKTLPDLQKAMKDIVDKAHLPGAGVALISNGELLWCGGLGKADTPRAAAPRADVSLLQSAARALNVGAPGDGRRAHATIEP